MAHTYRYSHAEKLYPLLFLIVAMIVVIAVLGIMIIRTELDPDFPRRKFEYMLQACSKTPPEKPPLLSAFDIASLIVTAISMIWVVMVYENEILMILVEVLGGTIFGLHIWLRRNKWILRNK